MKTIKVINDTEPMNPRKEMDNFGVMVYWHNNYILGDEKPECTPEEFVKELPKGTIVIPLYLYDHGGITIQTKAFSCPWDSGQIGFIYATPTMIRKEFSKQRISQQIKEKVKNILNCEVKTYDQYLRGAVWGYMIEETETCQTCENEHSEVIDSCYGFYGDTLEETGMKYNVDPELHEALEKAFDNPIFI